MDFQNTKNLNDSTGTIMADAPGTRQCRTCRHKPRSWARWETSQGTYHDGRCLKAKQITRPGNTCREWEGWERAEDDGK